jgi:alkylation response protein AidB-like acyl-CoA dehydrogenase
VDFSLSPAAQDASDRMWAFMREEVFPAEPEWAAEPYRRQSMLLVPEDTPGLTIIRHLPIFGYQDQHGHSELVFHHEVHGAAGVSDDIPLAYSYAWARVLRIVDGPDAVHRRSIARHEQRRERPFSG